MHDDQDSQHPVPNRHQDATGTQLHDHHAPAALPPRPTIPVIVRLSEEAFVAVLLAAQVRGTSVPGLLEEHAGRLLVRLRRLEAEVRGQGGAPAAAPGSLDVEPLP